MRYAAIDIGSNAVRFLVSEVIENHHHIDFHKTLFIRVPIRLGSSVFTKQKVAEESVVDLEKAMQAFRHLMDVYKVVDYKACATAAMREASNGKEVVERIYKRSNIKIDIIDGKLEASLIHTTHIAEELDAENTYMYIDVGGGSTEITLFYDNHIVASSSFPIGTIRLLVQDNIEPAWDDLKHWLKQHLNNHRHVVGIGTGGNINKIAKMIGRKEGKALSRNDIKNLYNYISGFTYDERISILGLNPDRADVIVPAAKIFLTIMKHADIEEMIVPKLGLVDGIIHMLYEKGTIKT